MTHVASLKFRGQEKIAVQNAEHLNSNNFSGVIPPEGKVASWLLGGRDAPGMMQYFSNLVSKHIYTFCNPSDCHVLAFWLFFIVAVISPAHYL